MKHSILGTGELTPEGTSKVALKIRRAISHAIPRQKIIDDLLLGSAKTATSPVPDCNPDFDTSLIPYAYDFELAKNLLGEVGYKIGKASLNGISVMIIGFLSLAAVMFFKRKNNIPSLSSFISF